MKEQDMPELNKIYIRFNQIGEAKKLQRHFQSFVQKSGQVTLNNVLAADRTKIVETMLKFKGKVDKVLKHSFEEDSDF